MNQVCSQQSTADLVLMIQGGKGDYAEVWLCQHIHSVYGSFYDMVECIESGKRGDCFEFVYENLCGYEEPEKHFAQNYDDVLRCVERRRKQRLAVS